MISEACIKKTNVSRIKVEENGKSAVIMNLDREEFSVVKVDGCAIVTGLRADFVIEKDDAAAIIELKGKGAEHGADQVHRTAQVWTKVEKRALNVCGLIVSRQYPKASTSMQLKQQAFVRAFGFPLHVVTHNAEYDFRHLFSFSGPFKG